MADDLDSSQGQPLHLLLLMNVMRSCLKRKYFTIEIPSPYAFVYTFLVLCNVHGQEA